MFDSLTEQIKQARKDWKSGDDIPLWMWEALSHISNPTDKDFFVAIFLNGDSASSNIQSNSRIVPALFFSASFFQCKM